MNRAQRCPRFCDEVEGHAGNHRGYVAEVVPEVFSPAMVSVTVECGPAETTPLPVVSLSTRTGHPVARLSWADAEELVKALTAAATRWAS